MVRIGVEVEEVQRKLPDAKVMVLDKQATHLIIFSWNWISKKQVEEMKDLFKAADVKVILVGVNGSPDEAIKILEINPG